MINSYFTKIRLICQNNYYVYQDVYPFLLEIYQMIQLIRNDKNHYININREN